MCCCCLLSSRVIDNSFLFLSCCLNVCVGVMTMALQDATRKRSMGERTPLPPRLQGIFVNGTTPGAANVMAAIQDLEQQQQKQQTEQEQLVSRRHTTGRQAKNTGRPSIHSFIRLSLSFMVAVAIFSPQTTHSHTYSLTSLCSIGPGSNSPRCQKACP